MRAFWLLILLSLALAVPGSAWAQTPTDDTYDPVDIRTEERSAAGPGGNGDGDGDGDLPYTGGDIALVVLAGAAILGTGFAIRRASQT